MVDAVDFIAANCAVSERQKTREEMRRDLMEFLGPLAGPAKKLCKAILSQTPKIQPERCVGCGICQKACPGKAITLENGKHFFGIA